MNNHIALISTILTTLAVGGCAASVGQPGQGEEADGEFGSLREAAANAPGHDPRDIELSFSAVNVAGDAIAVSGCGLFSRKPGTHNELRADGISPACGFDEVGSTRLPVDSNSEVVFAMAAPNYPQTLTHIRTGDGDMDVSDASYRLLDTQHIDAAYADAGLPKESDRSTVIVEIDTDGAIFELLLYTTGEGPAAIYLDADGAPTEGATAGGWVVFPNVEFGMHAVSFGHPELDCQQADDMGWGGWQDNTTTAWAIGGYATHVAAIGCGD